MPITPIDSITYANQNMNVAATKQNEYQNRVQKQSYAAAEAMALKEGNVEEINDLTEDKAIDPEQEHNREQAEKETKAKEAEIKLKLEKKTKKEDESESPYHILNIKV